MAQKHRAWRWRPALAIVTALVVFVGGGALAAEPTPPGQPESGPGGADYPHATIAETVLGNGDGQIWIFEPNEPKPESAPIVLFLHGWNARQPAAYKSWIRHLARRGNIVLYPRYQASALTRPERMTGNAVRAIREALALVEKGEHVRPDREKVAAVGHSLGGVMAVNIAARAEAAGLPRIRAIMSVEPGDSKGSRIAAHYGRDVPSILEDYAGIAEGTLFLVVVGEDDRVVGDRTANEIWRRVGHLPKDDRDYITVRSDWHGRPALPADHFFPAAPGVAVGKHSAVDALDFYGTWKLFDGLTDAAFCGNPNCDNPDCRCKNRGHALGDTPEQRFMGTWSDGTPVKELEVLEK